MEHTEHTSAAFPDFTNLPYWAAAILSDWEVYKQCLQESYLYNSVVDWLIDTGLLHDEAFYESGEAVDYV